MEDLNLKSVIAGYKTLYQDELEYLNALYTKEGIEIIADEMALALDGAWRAIAKYLLIDYYSDFSKFSYAIIELGKVYYAKAMLENGNVSGQGQQITQQTLGSWSVTFRNNNDVIGADGLIESVRAKLPYRKLKRVPQ